MSDNADAVLHRARNSWDRKYGSVPQLELLTFWGLLYLLQDGKQSIAKRAAARATSRSRRRVEVVESSFILSEHSHLLPLAACAVKQAKGIDYRHVAIMHTDIIVRETAIPTLHHQAHHQSKQEV